MLLDKRLKKTHFLWFGALYAPIIGYEIYVQKKIFTTQTGAESDLQNDFNAEKTQLVSFGWSNNSAAIDVKINGYVLKEKSSLKMLQLSFCCKMDLDSYFVSIAKVFSQKIGAQVSSTQFLSLEFALYLYKSTRWLCLEYC